MKRLIVTALLLSSLQAAPACVLSPCSGSATLQNASSGCTAQGSQVKLHTAWQLPAAAQEVPLHLRVAGVMSFPLDGCGNHAISTPVPIQIQGFPCPVSIPGVYGLNISVTLPSFVPHATYQIQLDGRPLLCAQVRVPLWADISQSPLC